MFSRSANMLGLGVLLALSVSCGSDDSVVGPDNPGNQSNDRITITNDEGALADRVTYFDDVEIPIEDPSQERSHLQQSITLRLTAEVLPPTIDGEVLQATCVSMKGNANIAVVSYNMRGAPHMGGIDVFNITNKRRPKLESGAVLNDTDVNYVSFDAGWVYAAEATSAAGFPYPAVVEMFRLSGVHLVLEGNVRTPLTSFAGTGAASGNALYATSGDGGAVFVLDPGDLSITDSVDLHDARMVDVADDRVVVVQGTPGQISVFDETDMSLVGSHSFPGADVPESKSTVEIVGGKAFVAAGPEGVQILSVDTGTIVGNVPRPNPADLGLDPSVVVTNAVAADDDLLFISNGEAGVYVAQGTTDFGVTGSETAQEITVLGQLQFDDLQSVNHVAFKNNYLIIAAGLGGLKIVEVTVR